MNDPSPPGSASIAGIALVLLLHSFGLTPTGWTQDDPPQLWDATQAQVTLPYAELKTLWDAAKRHEDAHKTPPVEAVVRSLEATLVIEESSVQLRTEFEVESFVDGWHQIALLGGGGRLTTLEPADANVLWENGAYHLLQQGTGSQNLMLEFISPRTGGARESLLQFSPPSATVQTLRIEGVPEGRGLEINGVPQRSIGGQSRMVLAQGGEPLQLFLTPAAEVPVPAELAASTWDTTAQVVTQYVDGALHHEARIFAQDRTGDGQSLRLQLPNNARNVMVTSETLLSQRPLRVDSQLVYELVWEDSGALNRSIELAYEVPVSPLADAWPLSVPKTAEADGKHEALFVLPLIQGLEIAGDGIVASADSQRISSWFQERLGNSDFVSLQTAADRDIEPRWLPRRATAQATITEASFETQLEKNGRTLNQAVLEVQHDAPLLWQMTLPESCNVLRCTLNGKAVAPVSRGESIIEFGLTPDEQNTTVVAIAYTHRTDPLLEIEGSSVMELPQTPLFIQQLSWSLRIPETYVISAVDGNLEVTGQTKAQEPNTISLIKYLCEGETPTVEVFYRRPTAEDS